MKQTIQWSTFANLMLAVVKTAANIWNKKTEQTTFFLAWCLPCLLSSSCWSFAWLLDCQPCQKQFDSNKPMANTNWNRQHPHPTTATKFAWLHGYSWITQEIKTTNDIMLIPLGFFLDSVQFPVFFVSAFKVRAVVCICLTGTWLTTNNSQLHFGFLFSILHFPAIVGILDWFLLQTLRHLLWRRGNIVLIFNRAKIVHIWCKKTNKTSKFRREMSIDTIYSYNKI